MFFRGNHEAHVGSQFVLFGVLLLSLFVVGCDLSPEVDDKTVRAFNNWSDKSPGTLVERDCGFKIDPSLIAQCYHFVVLQDRDSPENKKIALAVAVISNASVQDVASPIVYLEGGPGGPALPAKGFSIEDTSWILEDFRPVFDGGRSLVLVDGRGIGASEPFLSCPEARLEGWRRYRVHPENRESAAYINEIDQCLMRLQNSGVNFSNYDSFHLAQDLKELRIAFGWEQWFLYGVSYGSVTAMELLNLDPNGVQGVVFDSPSYERGDIWNEDQKAFDRILDILADKCANQEICDEVDGAILERFYSGLQELDQSPMRIRRNLGYNPIYVDRYLALYGLHLLLYYQSGHLLFEDIVLGVNEQNKNSIIMLMNEVYKHYTPSGFSDIVHWTTGCQEQNVFGEYDYNTRFPVYNRFDIETFQHICQRMSLSYSRGHRFHSSKTSVPIIVFSGELDPITPPAYGAALARDIGAQGHYVVSGQSHGVAFDEGNKCVEDMLTAFLASPPQKPDDACLASDEKAAQK